MLVVGIYAIIYQLIPKDICVWKECFEKKPNIITCANIDYSYKEIHSSWPFWSDFSQSSRRNKLTIKWCEQYDFTIWLQSWWSRIYYLPLTKIKLLEECIGFCVNRHNLIERVILNNRSRYIGHILIIIYIIWSTNLLYRENNIQDNGVTINNTNTRVPDQENQNDTTIKTAKQQNKMKWYIFLVIGTIIIGLIMWSVSSIDRWNVFGSMFRVILILWPIILLIIWLWLLSATLWTNKTKIKIIPSTNNTEETNINKWIHIFNRVVRVIAGIFSAIAIWAAIWIFKGMF